MIDLIQQAKVRIWLLLVGVFTLLIGTSYILVQQSTRLAANDLPLANAQTISHQLAAGAAPSDVVPAVKTDLANDVTPFAIITDSSQHLLASSALLAGQTPLPPAGAFSYAKANGSDHFTWQPAANARLATEVLTYGSGPTGGFIITGQSIRLVENRITTYGEIALAGWVGMVAWTSLCLFLIPSPTPTKSRKKK